MKKKALLVGINYVGTAHELRGCINDSNNIKNFLVSQGFDDIKTLLEAEATTEGIKDGLNWLVSDLDPGDIIVFHYSGHGSQLPSTKELDGFEEIICPIDLDWKKKVITDDTLREIFNRVPQDVNTTLILDCCHSGNMLDQANSLNLERKELVSEITDPTRISRFLPPPSRIKKKLTDRSLVNWSTSKDINNNALLIAGCRANQTSADAEIDGIYQGAATASLLKLVKNNPTISYRSLVTEMNDFMHRNNFSQQPDLDGSPSLYDKVFISQFIKKEVEDEKMQTEEVIESSKDKKTLLYGLALLLLMIVIFASL